MFLPRQIVGRSTVLLLLGAGIARGQAERLWATQVTVDVGTFPDELSTRCGGSAGAALGAGIAAVYRPRTWMLLQADTRGNAIAIVGCPDVGIPAVQIGPNLYENEGVLDPKGIPRRPWLRSGVRVGAQTPWGWPFVRATVGTGLFWSTSLLPYGSAALGVGSRGRVRFYAEWERDVARIRVTETHARMSFDPFTQLAPRVESVVVHPRWAAVHIGVEVPIVSGGAGAHDY